MLAVAVAVGFAFAAITPWILVAVTLAVVALALAQRMGWTLAAAGSVVVMFVTAVLLARVLQPIAVELDVKVRIALLAIAVGSLIAMWLVRNDLRVPSWAVARPVLAFVAPLAAAAVVLMVLVTVSAPTGSRISWAMINDAVWNTVSARFVADDGGLSVARPNSSPLTALLLAVAVSTGRGSVAAGDALLHDVTREAQLWLLLILVSSVLAGLIARAGLHMLRPLARGVASFAVACIPLSSFVIGYAFQFGFYNVTISLIVLLCSWIAWTHARRSPLAATIALSLSTLALLSAWAPLAIVPLALALGVVVRAGPRWVLGLRGSRLLAVLAAILAVPAYAVAVTIPDLLREGDALSADGGIFLFAPANYILVMTVTLIVLLLTAWRGRMWSNAVGLGIVVLAGGVGLSYLVAQRLGLDQVWGYYPIKYSWILAMLMIIVLAVTMLSWMSGSAKRAGAWGALRKPGVAAATALVILGLLHWPELTEESRDLPLSLISGSSNISSDVVATLFARSNPENVTVLARYSDDRSDDQFVNSWLIQQHATDSKDPIRPYAYYLDGSDAYQLCDLARLLPTRLMVLTKSPPLRAEVDAACPGLGVNVVVH
ncbi:hypothetical protein GCM10007382_14550 [Salinibacterium xinjiangense]|nr:hypothetical protein GCM10007382_14550 [Salinibacterium xinjiangense]